MKRIAVYPGSFDPITNGHLDVIERATRLFDEVIVAIAGNEAKHPLFNMKERHAMVMRAIRRWKNVCADDFPGLLVEYVKQRKACAVIRGLRAVSDFEFEFQMALMNRKLDPRVETIFLMPKEEYTYLSSRMIKEIAKLGGNVSGFVPSFVAAALVKKLHES
jgi:pantetheine-phosphate adenylyltransferase